VEESILKSIKKLSGLPENYTAFDTDMTMFINSALSSLKELGVGPTPMIMIDGYETKWADLGLSDDALALAKIYVYLKVRLIFDPPAMSFLIEAVEKQIKEQEWRLVAFHDDTAAATYAPDSEIEEVV
jgi:hypothetical protein